MEEKRDIEKVGSTISKKEAKEMVAKYKKENPKGTHGFLFGRDILLKLMAYEGSRGIWFYKGINEEGEEHLVMYPADEKGKILNYTEEQIKALSESPDNPADRGRRCPPICPDGD